MRVKDFDEKVYIEVTLKDGSMDVVCGGEYIFTVLFRAYRSYKPIKVENHINEGIGYYMYTIISANAILYDVLRRWQNTKNVEIELKRG